MTKPAKQKKRGKRIENKEERAVEEEVAKLTKPHAEERGTEKVEGSGEPAAAEKPEEETAPEERPPLKRTILQQCMEVPSFRTRVIHHLARKLR